MMVQIAVLALSLTLGVAGADETVATFKRRFGNRDYVVQFTTDGNDGVAVTRDNGQTSKELFRDKITQIGQEPRLAKYDSISGSLPSRVTVSPLDKSFDTTILLASENFLYMLDMASPYAPIAKCPKPPGRILEFNMAIDIAPDGTQTHYYSISTQLAAGTWSLKFKGPHPKPDDPIEVKQITDTYEQAHDFKQFPNIGFRIYSDPSLSTYERYSQAVEFAQKGSINESELLAAYVLHLGEILDQSKAILAIPVPPITYATLGPINLLIPAVGRGNDEDRLSAYVVGVWKAHIGHKDPMSILPLPVAEARRIAARVGRVLNEIKKQEDSNVIDGSVVPLHSCEEALTFRFQPKKN